MVNLPILWTVLTVAKSSPAEFVDPNCPDYDLSLLCVSKCDNAYLECTSTCSTSQCLMECNRASVTCSDACPCHLDCIDGCEGCGHPICSGNDDSNDDNLEKAVLVLNTKTSSSPAVLIQPNGCVTKNFKFKINDDTAVSASCSATLNGEVFVFGGSKKQISKIVGCELRRTGDLDDKFNMGTCGTYNFPDPRILLCFAHGKSTGCESFDGSIFYNQASSNYGHHRSSLAKTSHGAPLIVGAERPLSNKAEIMDIASNTWTEIAEYPFHDDIFAYATVTTSQGTLIIGGCIAGSLQVATVACYNNTKWSRLDDLQSARAYHRAIINGDKVYVIGGSGKKYTEIWSDDQGSKNIKLADPKLNNYSFYPELVLVDPSFCVEP